MPQMSASTNNSIWVKIWKEPVFTQPHSMFSKVALSEIQMWMIVF